MPETKVICIINNGNFAYLVYDTIENIQKIFTGVNITPVVVDGVNTTLYYVKVETLPTEGVQVIKDTVNEQPSSDKLNLFRITRNDVDYKDIIAKIAEIMNKLEIEIQSVKQAITNIILYGSDKEKWPKDGGKKRYRSSRKSSSSRRRRSTKRRTTSRKQQKRRRATRSRAH